jgi:hypothetical protein
MWCVDNTDNVNPGIAFSADSMNYRFALSAEIKSRFRPISNAPSPKTRSNMIGPNLRQARGKPNNVGVHLVIVTNVNNRRQGKLDARHYTKAVPAP